MDAHTSSSPTLSAISLCQRQHQAGLNLCCFHPIPRLRELAELTWQSHTVQTLRLRCAGSDLQSRSMCSPTTTSGISPRLTGTGVLQRGHTGTCTSCRDNKRELGAGSWATLSATQSPLSLSGPAYHGFHNFSCSLRSCFHPPASLHSRCRGTDIYSGKMVWLGDAQTTQWEREGWMFVALRCRSWLSGTSSDSVHIPRGTAQATKATRDYCNRWLEKLSSSMQKGAFTFL